MGCTAVDGYPVQVRAKWVAATVQMAQAQHLDGITFDYESPIAWNDPARDYYVTLVNETTEAMHAAVPGSQVNPAVATSSSSNQQQ